MPHYHDDDHPLASLNKKSWGEITKHFLPTNFISDTAMDGPKTAALKNTEKLKLEQAEQAKRGGRAEQPTQKAPTSTVPVKRRSKTHTAGGDSESGEIQQPPKKRRQTATSLIPSGSGMLASPSASTGSYPQSRLAPSVDVHMGGYDDEEAPPDSAAGTEDEPMTDSGYSDTDWGVFSS
jgi:hypothetical protein